MLVVETIAKIRRAHFVDGKPIKQICRELKLSRKVDPARLIPGSRLIFEVAVDTFHTFWRTAHGALEQRRNPALKNTIGAQPDGVSRSLAYVRQVRDQEQQASV